MDATDARKGLDLLDEVDADLPSLAGTVARAGHPGDDLVRNVKARNVSAHPFRGLGGSQRPDTHQDEHLAKQSQVLHLA